MGGAESVVRNTDKRTSRREHRETFQEAVSRFRVAPFDSPAQSSSSSSQSSGRSVRVCVRKRPFFPHEEQQGEFDVVSCLNGRVVVHDARMRPDMRHMIMNHHDFAFDEVFGDEVDNTAVYNATAHEIVVSAINGFSGTIMCYGQTGSGKTFTMSSIYEHLANELFDQVGSRSVSICFIELLGDKCYDMLNGGGQCTLATAADGSVHPYPCVEVQVADATELRSLIDMAGKLRATAATGVHDQSSRSHACCRIFIDGSKETEGEGEGCITLVDLAGTEHRIDSAEHNTERQREGAKINASLAALKDCIRATAAGARFVPFRRNWLTQLLRGCFSGTEPHTTIIVATVSPSSKDTEHSLNTLRHACIMDGQGVGAVAGTQSAHVSGGAVTTEALGEINVTKIARERTSRRKSGAERPSDLPTKAPPSHQAKSSNTVRRSTLDRHCLQKLRPRLAKQVVAARSSAGSERQRARFSRAPSGKIEEGKGPSAGEESQCNEMESLSPRFSPSSGPSPSLALPDGYTHSDPQMPLEASPTNSQEDAEEERFPSAAKVAWHSPDFMNSSSGRGDSQQSLPLHLALDHSCCADDDDHVHERGHDQWPVAMPRLIPIDSCKVCKLWPGCLHSAVTPSEHSLQACRNVPVRPPPTAAVQPTEPWADQSEVVPPTVAGAPEADSEVLPRKEISSSGSSSPREASMEANATRPSTAAGGTPSTATATWAPSAAVAMDVASDPSVLQSARESNLQVSSSGSTKKAEWNMRKGKPLSGSASPTVAPRIVSARQKSRSPRLSEGASQREVRSGLKQEDGAGLPFQEECPPRRADTSTSGVKDTGPRGAKLATSRASKASMRQQQQQLQPHPGRPVRRSQESLVSVRGMESHQPCGPGFMDLHEHELPASWAGEATGMSSIEGLAVATAAAWPPDLVNIEDPNPPVLRSPTRVARTPRHGELATSSSCTSSAPPATRAALRAECPVSAETAGEGGDHEKAMALFGLFCSEGRNAREWRKNDLRLISTCALPALFGERARIDWAHPSAALDELERLVLEQPLPPEFEVCRPPAMATGLQRSQVQQHPSGCAAARRRRSASGSGRGSGSPTAASPSQGRSPVCHRSPEQVGCRAACGTLPLREASPVPLSPGARQASQASLSLNLLSDCSPTAAAAAAPRRAKSSSLLPSRTPRALEEVASCEASQATLGLQRHRRSSKDEEIADLQWQVANTELGVKQWLTELRAAVRQDACAVAS